MAYRAAAAPKGDSLPAGGQMIDPFSSMMMALANFLFPGDAPAGGGMSMSSFAKGTQKDQSSIGTPGQNPPVSPLDMFENFRQQGGGYYLRTRSRLDKDGGQPHVGTNELLRHRSLDYGENLHGKRNAGFY